MRRTWILLAAATALAAGTVVVPAAISSAAEPTPTLSMLSPVHDAVIERGGRERKLYASLGVYLAAVDGPFELMGRRAPNGDIEVSQVRREANGDVTVLRQLPTSRYTKFHRGVGQFVHLDWRNSEGTVVESQNAPFCPASWSTARIDDSGPAVPAYPTYCYGTELTQATVWGIDRGWAVRALDGPIDNPDIPDGTYTLEVSVGAKYAAALEMTNTPVALQVELTSYGGGGCCPIPAPSAAQAAGADQGAAAEAVDVPAGARPDLVPLPAFAPLIETGKEDKTRLAFASNVWNAGAGPLLVEGFRSGDEPHMTAKQFFVQDGEVVAREDVGDFDFDDRRNHHHWHFEDFAVYELVSEATGDVVKSGKQSFCLAPTDPIDMTIPGASWLTERRELESACGAPDSIWIREAMPSGWGDTYYQSRAGQAFNITTVPNGIYAIRVTTNFEQNLVESDYTNNVSELRVRLGGQVHGERTVTVL